MGDISAAGTHIVLFHGIRVLLTRRPSSLPLPHSSILIRLLWEGGDTQRPGFLCKNTDKFGKILINRFLKRIPRSWKNYKLNTFLKLNNFSNLLFFFFCFFMKLRNYSSKVLGPPASAFHSISFPSTKFTIVLFLSQLKWFLAMLFLFSLIKSSGFQTKLIKMNKMVKKKKIWHVVYANDFLLFIFANFFLCTSSCFVLERENRFSITAFS